MVFLLSTFDSTNRLEQLRLVHGSGDSGNEASEVDFEGLDHRGHEDDISLGDIGWGDPEEGDTLFELSVRVSDG